MQKIFLLALAFFLLSSCYQSDEDILGLDTSTIPDNQKEVLRKEMRDEALIDIMKDLDNAIGTINFLETINDFEAILLLQEKYEAYYAGKLPSNSIKDLLKPSSLCPEPIKYKSVIKTKTSQSYWKRKEKIGYSYLGVCLESEKFIKKFGETDTGFFGKYYEIGDIKEFTQNDF